MASRQNRRRLQRAASVRTKRRKALGRLTLMTSILHQIKLKRLQRGPLLKTKKQEVYDKWEKKKRRRMFQQRRKRFEYGRILNQSSTNAIQLPPIQCQLWHCNRRRRENRTFDHEDEFLRQSTRKRKASSTVSSQRSRSRSPIIIGSLL